MPLTKENFKFNTVGLEVCLLSYIASLFINIFWNKKIFYLENFYYIAAVKTVMGGTKLDSMGPDRHIYIDTYVIC